ncbi:fructose-bisphosphate aldolase class I [Patescibacteria group bacterium]|nr:fructose-bisphosphate aldolase class I [Patescibacteria group bacterium]
MNITKLQDIAKSLVASKKGILAADESTKTIQKRFDKIGTQSNPETNLAYRKMLFTTPGIEEFLSGVILFDETIRQEIDGVSVPKYLESKGILPGIKVDKGDWRVNNGLNGLERGLAEYKKMGAKFTKWRVVTKVEEASLDFVDGNAEVLSKFAVLSQQAGLVPIIEPEILRDGEHNLVKCQEITSRVLTKVFEKIKASEVDLAGLLLKTNMTTSGQDNSHQDTPEEVAHATIETFNEVVPKEVPGIVFLSGGQTPDQATENLAAICKINGPWQLSFSFGRALQVEPLQVWAGKEENIHIAQQAFLERCQKVSRARSI